MPMQLLTGRDVVKTHFFLEVDAGDVVSRSTEEVNFRTTSFYEDLHRSIMVIDFAGCVVPYVFFSQNWSTPFHR